MLIQKMQISIVLIILGATLLNSGASTSLQESDSIGRMPEITVTAPRYEYQNEAWLGMVEGVVVEARRPSSSINGIVLKDGSNGMVSGNMSSKGVKSMSMHFGDPMYLVISSFFMLVALSIVYMYFRAYLAAKEVKHDRTKH